MISHILSLHHPYEANNNILLIVLLFFLFLDDHSISNHELQLIGQSVAFYHLAHTIDYTETTLHLTHSIHLLSISCSCFLLLVISFVSSVPQGFYSSHSQYSTL